LTLAASHELPFPKPHVRIRGMLESSDARQEPDAQRPA